MGRRNPLQKGWTFRICLSQDMETNDGLKWDRQTVSVAAWRRVGPDLVGCVYYHEDTDSPTGCLADNPGPSDSDWHWRSLLGPRCNGRAFIKSLPDTDGAEHRFDPKLVPYFAGLYGLDVNDAAGPPQLIRLGFLGSPTRVLL